MLDCLSRPGLDSRPGALEMALVKSLIICFPSALKYLYCVQCVSSDFIFLPALLIFLSILFKFFVEKDSRIVILLFTHEIQCYLFDIFSIDDFFNQRSQHKLDNALKRENAFLFNLLNFYSMFFQVLESHELLYIVILRTGNFCLAHLASFAIGNTAVLSQLFSEIWKY